LGRHGHPVSLVESEGWGHRSCETRPPRSNEHNAIHLVARQPQPDHFDATLGSATPFHDSQQPRDSYRVKDRRRAGRIVGRKAIAVGRAILYIGLSIMQRQKPSRYLSNCVRAISSLAGYEGSVGCLTWSPNSTRLAASSTDSTLRLWDIEKAQPRFKRNLSGGPVTDLDWSFDGGSLACSCEDGIMILCDPRTLEPRYFHQISREALNCVAWAPSDRRLAVAGNDFKVYVLNCPSTERTDSTQISIGHRSAVRRIVLSGQGTEAR
jgi:WD40 repeat protein